MTEDLKWPRRIGLLIILVGTACLFRALPAMYLGSDWAKFCGSTTFLNTFTWTYIAVGGLVGYNWWRKGEVL